MKVAVIGAGGWGTALALVLQANGHEVLFWCRTEEKAAQLRRSRDNPRLPGVRLPETLEIISRPQRLGEAELVVFVTPSFALRETAASLAPYLSPRAVLVSAVKGIEEGSNLRMSQILQEECGFNRRIAALSGPSHAEEVGRGMPTGCVAATPDLSLARLVQDVFMNSSFRVYSNQDIVGVELGGALKNVLALCCGIGDGLGYGDNTKALLMTRGLTEMARLGVQLGGRQETFAGLSGMGDLIVTCTSMHSRNRRCGILIGQGKSFPEAAREVGAVVEGYYAAQSAMELSEKKKVELPIVRCVYEVLYQGRRPDSAVSELMSRKKRDESDESWLAEED